MIDELAPFNLSVDPIQSFLDWYDAALKIEDNADAMTLATYAQNGERPMARTVLYKGLKQEKLVFYTNYLSNKGQQINENQEVSLLFYWHKSIRQIRIQGKVVKSSAEESDNYFYSRDRESQFASYISNQSAPVKNKQELVDRLAIAQAKFKDIKIPRPEHWGGYQVIPYEFEFFTYGKHRLNDRFLFVLNNQEWIITRLQP